MRRLSLYRRRAKVRNPQRHLRALRRWAESAKGKYPASHGARYMNYKIPVLDRLVSPPVARSEWQAQALESLLIAARHFMEAKPASEQGRSWVAVLVDYPDMWPSEVTVFYDRAYYESFLFDDGKLRERSLCARLGVAVPPGMRETGSLFEYQKEDEQGRMRTVRGELWVIGEPLEGWGEPLDG